MVARWLQRQWFEQRRLAPALWLLVPLSGLYSAVADYRRGKAKAERLPVPVIVVGNITVGGAGKTPLTLWLTRQLQDRGWRPGIVSRGYGSTHFAPRPATADSSPAEVGDEPVLLARRSGVPVWVGRDRVVAGRALLAAHPEADVILCDDGLQHYRLARAIEIEVVDGARRYGNGLMLPAGPLREPVARRRRCDLRVVNLGHALATASAYGFGEWPMHLHARAALPMVGGRARALQSFAGMRVHAVAGIGNPQRFFDMLRGLGIGVVPHAFPDHHAYGVADLDFGNDLPVLMTEKDAVKCAAFADSRCHVVPVDAELPEAFWIALGERLGRPPGPRADP